MMMRILIIVVLLQIPFLLTGKTVAIIENRSTLIDVKTKDHVIITESVRIKIFDEDGYEHAVYRTYYSAFRSIRSIRYTVYDALGNKVKRLTKTDAIDLMFNSSYETADVRTLYLDPEFRTYPFTIEIETEISYNGFIDFPTWMPRYAPGVEVKNALLTFTCPLNYHFNTYTHNAISKPLEIIADGKKSLKWEIQDLAALPEYKSYELFVDDQPAVRIAPRYFQLDGFEGWFDSWSSFGDWYLNVNVDQTQLSAETQKELRLLKEASKDERELVTKVYEYMQARTRYVSIQLGIGGYRALPVALVDTKGYGDCKALSSYMHHMLEYVGIKSNYVLVNAGEDSPAMITEFPSNQFNHVFLAVPLPTDTVWLECTTQIMPASYVGSFTDDRHALWIEKGKSRVIRTPVFSESDSKIISNCEVKLDAEGNAMMKIVRTQKGVFYDDIMLYKSVSKERLASFHENIFNYKDFTLGAFTFKEDRTEPSLDLMFDLSIKGLAKKLSGKLVVPLNVLTPIQDILEVDQVNKRSTVRRAFTFEDNVLIVLPDNFYTAFTPPVGMEKSDFGEVEYTLVQEGSQLRINRKIMIKKGVYKDADCDQLNEFIKKIRALEQGRIVFQNKT